MAEFNFRIGEGIRATSLEILLKGIGIQALKSKLFREIDFETDEPDAISYLGTPIFDQLTIKGGNFFEIDDINKENPIPYPDEDGADGFGLVIPSVIIEVTQSKNIITTAIQGRNGTVKEFVSDGDFVITLTGLIIGRNENGEVKDIGNVFPSDDIKKLITICKVPDVITLKSTFLNDLFGINEVVVTGYNIPQREASKDMQPFQISMLSDVPIDLEELTTE
ncbi:MAG: DUF6046 domain-containing protein [Candidatus Anammoxibacter sp.]